MYKMYKISLIFSFSKKAALWNVAFLFAWMNKETLRPACYRAMSQRSTSTFLDTLKQGMVGHDSNCNCNCKGKSLQLQLQLMFLVVFVEWLFLLEIYIYNIYIIYIILFFSIVQHYLHDIKTNCKAVTVRNFLTVTALQLHVITPVPRKKNR